MAVYLTTTLRASEAARVGACERSPGPPRLSSNQTTSLPLPGQCTLPFSARGVGTTRARFVLIPISIDEKHAGGLPGEIEALEV